LRVHFAHHVSGRDSAATGPAVEQVFQDREGSSNKGRGVSQDYHLCVTTPAASQPPLLEQGGEFLTPFPTSIGIYTFLPSCPRKRAPMRVFLDSRLHGNDDCNAWDNKQFFKLV
jgi:hypothetical protein